MARDALVAVLVVEDEAIVAQDLRLCLQGMGYEVLGPCATGEDAITAALEGQPDVVLMDIHLEGPIDGVEAASRIRDACGSAVVFLTSQSDEATLHRAQRARPLGYILKPFDTLGLRATLETVQERHREKPDPDMEAVRRALARSEAPSLLVTYTGRLLAANDAARALPLLAGGATGGVVAFWGDLADPERGRQMVTLGGADHFVVCERRPAQHAYMMVLVPAARKDDAETFLGILRSWIRHESRPAPAGDLPGDAPGHGG